MKEVLDFIVQYWQYISVGVVLIINILIFIIKKRPVMVQESLKQVLLSLLPGFIAGAEEAIGHGNGSTKLALVLNACDDWLQNNGFSLTPELKKFIGLSIENILSTPQKKEVR